MKRDHYIIPICSPSAPVLHAICRLTHLTKFPGLQTSSSSSSSSSTSFSSVTHPAAAFNCARRIHLSRLVKAAPKLKCGGRVSRNDPPGVAPGHRWLSQKDLFPRP